MTSEQGVTTEHSGSGSLARSLELLWGEEGTPSRGPRRGLTREQIVTTAVALANRDGIGALSMRNVAAELGVGTMTLYRYIPGKGELLDLMIDHVNRVDEGPLGGPDAGWRAALERLAMINWELYTGNPWLLQVNQVRPVLGPNSLAGLDTSLAPLDGLDLTGQERIAVLLTMDNYVVGAARSYVLERQAVRDSGTSDEEFWGAQEPYLVQAMESGVYPRVRDLPEDTFSLSTEESFRFGLSRLLDGFAVFFSPRSGG
ncbi:TetR/AcrR family transcriptional regulator [Streptomyces sp. HNM0574]|uniref:TetR/AcrR family transcriptional regulator n=1 Tax=Streptomyces sp. HNM0574 TaxID=2714954 RepID=UPI00146DED64|nr:TetR/AcrR family transcriptional regulator [Streptomyces sp. HNM0574]NLU70944.1 TetR/AcrR family transcriptional regulator [Streptomyces sp. HNM0574]